MKSFLSGDILELLREKLSKNTRVVIFSHINPDGDSVGSALALKLALEQHGVIAGVVVPNEIPSFLQWLPGCDSAVIAGDQKDRATQLVAKADVFFFVDFNELNRIDFLEASVVRNTSAFSVLIDHHPHPGIKADLILSDTGVSSTAELMYFFLQALYPDDTMTKEVAEALYTGVMTDTGGFSHNIRGPQMFRVVAELLKTGISHDKIHSRVYDNFTENRMRLMGFALHSRMKILRDLPVGYISLSLHDLKEFDFQPGDTEGFVNLPLSVEGVRCSALFLERKDYIKISFRSKGDIAVNEFSARYFNGGGHRNAAGGEAYTSLDKAIEKFEKEIRKYVQDI